MSCGTHLDKQSRIIHREYQHETSGALFIAQSPNKRFYFIGEKNNHFGYWISSDFTESTSNYYAGEYVIKQDTMFLKFYKNHFPSYIKHYFLKDSSGKILHQKINDATEIILNIKYREQKND